MRGFIILCFAAVAFAVPQGYNYNPVGGQHGGGFSGSSINSLGSSGLGISTGGGSGAGHFQGGQQGGFIGQSSGGHQQHQTIVSKRFYIHSAPEENDEDYQERHITVGVPRKNYNVVFIKSPQRSHKKASIKISPAVNEEKTVIYVLNKKSDSSDIQAEVIEHASPTTKPEVFFIKYKTNEEAAHAQQQIQAQYDSLGGSSQILDEGVAPVTSVIGSLGGGGGDAGGHGAGHGGSFGGGVSSGSFGSGGVSSGSFGSGGVSSGSFGNGGGVSSGSFGNGGGVSHGGSGIGVSQGSNSYLPPNL